MAANVTIEALLASVSSRIAAIPQSKLEYAKTVPFVEFRSHLRLEKMYQQGLPETRMFQLRASGSRMLPTTNAAQIEWETEVTVYLGILVGPDIRDAHAQAHSDGRLILNALLSTVNLPVQLVYRGNELPKPDDGDSERALLMTLPFLATHDEASWSG